MVLLLVSVKLGTEQCPENKTTAEKKTFLTFGENEERMLVSQKAMQNNELDDCSVISDPSKIFLSQNN